MGAGRGARRDRRRTSSAFIVENSKTQPLHFVFATAQVSLDWLILLSVAIGVVIGVLASQVAHRRRARKQQS